jgi:Fe(3+) dicitrate transport protein
MKNIALIFILLLIKNSLFAQELTNTVKDSVPQDTTELIEVNIIQKKNTYFLPKIYGTLIYAGKKTEIIHLDQTFADLSSNNARQVFAKVPGIAIWENDGSGIQTSIAARGLSPNRSWEFNMRQNGYDISSEAFGYPETYFTPPTEALEKIEIIRGAGSLQYGPQLGGLVNYVTKKSISNKPFSFESNQTIGSYGMLNTYNGIGGLYKKWSYYGYIHYRTGDGWRENSHFRTRTAAFTLSYQFDKNWNIRAEYTNMNNLNQQAGGLSDEQFQNESRMSFRSRNWMSTPWNLACVSVNYQTDKKLNASLKVFGTLGERNSVGFLKGITTADTLNEILGTFNPRQVDRDAYLNLGAELRVMYNYTLFNQTQSLTWGARVYEGNTQRRQQGIGTVGSEFNLDLSDSTQGKLWGKELQLTTKNAAIYLEHLVQLGNRLTITPGFRFEYIRTLADGYISPLSSAKRVDDDRSRRLFLMGLGLQFTATKTSNLYANVSQGYRPATFSEQLPSGTTETVDPNLKDAQGINADFGFRGSLREYLRFDIGAFAMTYENRIGSILVDGNPYKTNIGSSRSIGIESFVELDLLQLLMKNKQYGSLQIFVNYAFIDAKYTTWNNPAIANDPLLDIKGNHVEYAPRHTLRSGISYVRRALVFSAQTNFIDEVFTDAANTELPNATATVGKIAAYFVADCSMQYRFNSAYSAKIGVNNLTNEVYSTRRSTGYPGPGLLPGNGRTFYFTLSLRL